MNSIEQFEEWHMTDLKQLMSRDNFQLWLANNPNIEDIIDHLKFLDFWLEKSKDGGGQYVEDLKSAAYEHIKIRSRG